LGADDDRKNLDGRQQIVATDASGPKTAQVAVASKFEQILPVRDHSMTRFGRARLLRQPFDLTKWISNSQAVVV
jgi:hypothetical protein